MTTTRFLQRQHTVSQFWKAVQLVSCCTKDPGRLGCTLVYKLRVSVATGNPSTLVARTQVLGEGFFSFTNFLNLESFSFLVSYPWVVCRLDYQTDYMYPVASRNK